MPRRRPLLRLHHRDAALMLMAVLVAAAFGWVVMAFSPGEPRQNVAYTVDASGLMLSRQAVGDLLRRTLSGRRDLLVTVVRDGRGVSVGVTPQAVEDASIAAAGSFAEAIAKRLRETDWAAADAALTDEIADRLYQLDVRIRDAVARGEGGRSGRAGSGQAASLEVARLLRRREGLLARNTPAPAGGPAPRVSLHRHDPPTAGVAERSAAGGLFALLLAAIACRVIIGRRTLAVDGRGREGSAAGVVRPLRGLVFAEPAPEPAAPSQSPKAA